MNWRKHILIGAIGLNCVLYLGTALWLAVINTQHTQDELARYTSLTSEILDIEIKRMHRTSRTLITEYYSKSRRLDKKLFWPPNAILNITSLGISRDDSIESLLPSDHIPSIPQALLKESSYELFYLDSQQRPYLAISFGNLDFGDQNIPIKEHFVASFKFSISKWLEEIRSVSKEVDVSIIEQNQYMEPMVLHTTLKESLIPHLITQSPLQSQQDYDTFRELGSTGHRHKTTFIATLSGTKYVVLPVVLSKYGDAKQVIYYTLPLPQFASISLETVFVIIASLFITLVAFLLSGFYLVKHLDKQPK